ncbi:germination lipoprotein GerS-related protein [Clostridioides difficile]
MKKKIIISLLLIIPFISILLVVIFRGMFMPNNEEIIRELKNIKCYDTKVEYIIKNSKGEEREETVQYYSKDEGVRVEFKDDKVKIYKADGIHVKDEESNSEYVIESDMDILHSMAFMNKILSYPLKSDSIEEGQEEWGDKIYIQVDTELFLNNEHFNTARIFINKKTKTPIGIIIYDKDGNDSVRIIYDDFRVVKEIDGDLLK